jgi:hypothetical protein
MPTRPSLGLLPGTSRPVLRVTLLLSAAAVVATAAAGPAVAPGSSGAAPGAFALVLALHAALVGLLVWRPGPCRRRVVWARMAQAGIVFAAAALASGLLALFPATQSSTAAPMAWAPMAAFPLIHGGLVRWNRCTTGPPDPSDVLTASARSWRPWRHSTSSSPAAR